MRSATTWLARMMLGSPICLMRSANSPTCSLVSPRTCRITSGKRLGDSLRVACIKPSIIWRWPFASGMTRRVTPTSSRNVLCSTSSRIVSGGFLYG